MKTIKIINLLNKIANGEQPSHIRVYNRDWYWNNYDGYVTEGSLSTTPDAQIYLFGSYRLDFALDNEVEIIEDEFIDIEEFKEHQIFNTRDIFELQMFINKRNADYDCKINDLIKNQKKIIQALKDSE